MSYQLRRIRGVANTHRELPPVSMGRSIDEFFEEVSKKSNGGKVLPNWCISLHCREGDFC
jgi:alpha-mannosidase